MKQWIVDREQMAECARQMLAYDARVWTFTGTLGTGKTTLVQEILEQLGIEGPVQSPTYTYVSVYQAANGKTVYHFDLYRLSSYNEFIQAGFDEYLYDESTLCFVEWPEILKGHLPARTVAVTLAYTNDGKRLISLTSSSRT